MDQVCAYLKNKGAQCMEKSKHRKAQHYLSMAIIAYSSLEPTQPIINIINDLYYNMGISYLKCLDYPIGFHYYTYSMFLCSALYPPTKRLTMDTDATNKKVLIYTRFSNDLFILMCRFIPIFFTSKAPSEIIICVPYKLFSIVTRIPFLQHFQIVYAVTDTTYYDYHMEITSIPIFANIETSYDTNLKVLPYIRPDQQILTQQMAMVKTYSSGKKIVLLNLTYNRDIDDNYSKQIDTKYIQNLTEGAHHIKFLSLTNTVHAIDNTLVDTSLITYEKILAYISMAQVTITRCSIVAHLAASMNCQVYLVLEKEPEWIWYNSNWYNNITVFKQTDTMAWDDVFFNLKRTLQDI